MNYRCYFLDVNHRISGVTNFQATNDAEAIDIARAQAAASNSPGFELWQATRLVHKQG
jgi:hypothetical protein